MTNGITTEFPVMDTAATRVDATNDDITAMLAQVRGHVDGLRGAWRGQAHATFEQIMAGWDAESRKLNDALQGIAEMLRRNSTQFQSAEADASAALGRAGAPAAGPLAL